MKYTDEQLSDAVEAYVDALTLDDLRQRVAEDLYYGLRKSCDSEIEDFIELLEVNHEIHNNI